MKRREKKYFKAACLLFCIILTMPLIVYILNFGSYGFSDDPKDWSDFANFFGGILNTIIALLSLIILGTLTYFIGENSNIKNKQINILMRKFDAYNEFSSLLPTFSHLAPTLTRKMKHNSHLLKNKQSLQDPAYQNSAKEIVECMDFFLKFHFSLIYFESRFGHLFEYDFSSTDYKEMENLSYSLKEYFQEIMLNYSLGNGGFKTLPSEDLHRYIILTHEFANELKKEIS